MGLDQPWNPFNRAHYKKKPDATGSSVDTKGVEAGKGYFRNINADNDLNTVISVSVGTDWHDYVHFPFAHEVPSKFVQKTGVKEEPYRVDTYLYLFLLEKGYDTKAKQEGTAFSEAAAMGIPGKNVLAVIPIQRYFADLHGWSDSMSFRFVIGDPIRQPWAEEEWKKYPYVKSQLDATLAKIKSEGSAGTHDTSMKFTFNPPLPAAPASAAPPESNEYNQPNYD